MAIGVIAFRKITAAQTALGPEGLNRAVGRLADGVYDFADAVRVGMRERETELRSALGVDAGAEGSTDGSSYAGAAGRDALRR